jgi:hypothetical protein
VVRDVRKVPGTSGSHRRRWLLGIEPIFEGGWLHRGSRAQRWDVEDELVAVSIFGDVTVDLAGARTLPALVVVKAFAWGRDVDVLVADGTQVELNGRPGNTHLTNDVRCAPEKSPDHIVRIEAHTGLGDVTVRAAPRPARDGWSASQADNGTERNGRVDGLGE